MTAVAQTAADRALDIDFTPIRYIALPTYKGLNQLMSLLNFEWIQEPWVQGCRALYKLMAWLLVLLIC